MKVSQTKDLQAISNSYRKGAISVLVIENPSVTHVIPIFKIEILLPLLIYCDDFIKWPPAKNNFRKTEGERLNQFEEP